MSRLALLAVCALASISSAAAPPISHLEWAKRSEGRIACGNGPNG